MIFNTFFVTVQLAAAAICAAAGHPNHSSIETIAQIKRELMLAPRSDNVIFSKSTKLDSSIEEFPLFKFTGEGPDGATSTIDITCKKCYIKGNASAKITSTKDFNITTAAVGVKSSINSTLHQITDYASEVVHEMKDYISNTTDVFIQDVIHLDSFDDIQGFQLQPPKIDFDVDVDSFDNVSLEVVFTDAEIYVELAILLSAGVTYSLNLFTSTELGYEVGKVLIGFVATIDLILSVDSKIELDTGFHVKFDKDMAMKLALFSKEASHIEYHGGQFEFLPVTVTTAGAILHAVLRIGIKSGFSLSAGFGPEVEVFNKTGRFQLGAGIEASAYANAAEFITNVTAANRNDLSARGEDGAACDLILQQGYQMAIGAAAGASVQLLDNVWGPVPKTEIPIFYTQLSTGCATTKATSTVAPTASIVARADSGDISISTTTTEVEYVALQCLSAGMTNCPASLKSRVTNIVSTTLTATITSGQSPVWATNTAQSTVTSPVPFGAKAMTMTASSGKPTSFVPPIETSGSNEDGSKGSVIEGSTGGASNKLIIGLSVGLGVPLIVAIVAAIFFWKSRTKKRYGNLRPYGEGPTEAEHQ